MLNKLPKIHIAVISAMPVELEFIEQKFQANVICSLHIGEFEFNVYEYNNATILLAHTGIGTSFASSALTLINQSFNPEYIFLTGTAGGVKDGVEINDVVIVDKAFEAELQNVYKLVKDTPFESCLLHPFKNQLIQPFYNADSELISFSENLNLNKIKIHRGTAVTSNAFPAPVELYDQIKAQNVYCIDMETSAFYQTAWLLNIKVLAIRGISNILNQAGKDEHLDEAENVKYPYFSRVSGNPPGLSHSSINTTYLFYNRFSNLD